MKAFVNDVIQLDPTACRWGPLIGIVDEKYDWGGVRVFVQIPGQGSYYQRVKDGEYVVIGHAEWVPKP